MKEKMRTTRAQIMHGYLVMIAITVALVLTSTVCLCVIHQSYLSLARNRNNQSSTQEAVTAHYKWLDALSDSIQTGAEFTGSLDDNTCALGKWMSSIDETDLADGTIRASLEKAEGPHETIHSTASALIELSRTDPEGAFQRYSTEIRPLTTQVIADLITITERYKALSDTASDRLKSMIVLSLLAGIGLAVVAAGFALTYASRIAGKISEPVRTVAAWSDELSKGVEDLDTRQGDARSQCLEIYQMIASFERMANNIRENVSVVQRVADGDMTAYVHIRSTEDSLGKHLYRMVQNNDLLFADILNVAQSVATGADEISKASQSLAESVNVQAMSVTDLSDTVAKANDLVVQTVERTHEAARISALLQDEAGESQERMSHLVHSVDEIREASSRISAVIKTIDDIAFQTNILALNAAVEAARAGTAGKGFAVVADEVRNLALKSAESATQTKALIENSIQKTEQGSRYSKQAAQTMELMLSEVGKISGLVREIYTASEEQSKGIAVVHEEIGKISSAATSNAAISEESAAASQQMSLNAEQLRKYMDKFSLRERAEGQAYIPPEKRGDSEFIRAANEFYRMAKATGSYGRAVIAGEESGGGASHV